MTRGKLPHGDDSVGGAGATIYRGDDRRGLVSVEQTSPGPVFVVAAGSLLALVLLWVVVAPHVHVNADLAPLMTAQLDASTWAIALLLAVLCLVRWRLVGEAAALWFGVAAAVMGVAIFTIDYLVPLAISSDALEWLAPASTLVVMGLVVRALLSPDVDTSARPSRIVLGALAATATVTVVLQLLPPATQLLTPGVGGRDAMPVSVATLGFVAAWALLATWSLWRGLHGRRPLFAWFGLLFFALTFAELARHMPVPEGSVAGAAPALLRTFGAVCAVSGVTVELARAYRRQDRQLLESKASELNAETRAEVERASQAERAHEARNALMAIEGAVSTLQRYQDRLDSATRVELSAAVSNEVHRLQRLVSAERIQPSSPGRFRLTEVLAAVVTAARSQGTSVSQDVPNHLVAIGQPADTAQVLHNLFQNARRYGNGKISVRAILEGEHVVVRVEDDGPGIPEDERDRVFDRGMRGRAAVGNGESNGLGLYVSARLMRAQGGELRLEDAAGGACFAVVLPGFSELEPDEVETNASPRQDATEQVEQAGEFLVGREVTLVAFPHQRHAGPGSVEYEDGVGHDVAR